MDAEVEWKNPVNGIQVKEEKFDEGEMYKEKDVNKMSMSDIMRDRVTEIEKLCLSSNLPATNECLGLMSEINLPKSLMDSSYIKYLYHSMLMTHWKVANHHLLSQKMLDTQEKIPKINDTSEGREEINYVMNPFDPHQLREVYLSKEVNENGKLFHTMEERTLFKFFVQAYSALCRWREFLYYLMGREKEYEEELKTFQNENRVTELVDNEEVNDVSMSGRSMRKRLNIKSLINDELSDDDFNDSKDLGTMNDDMEMNIRLKKQEILESEIYDDDDNDEDYVENKILSSDDGDDSVDSNESDVDGSKGLSSDEDGEKDSLLDLNDEVIDMRKDSSTTTHKKQRLESFKSTQSGCSVDEGNDIISVCTRKYKLSLKKIIRNLHLPNIFFPRYNSIYLLNHLFNKRVQMGNGWKKNLNLGDCLRERFVFSSNDEDHCFFYSLIDPTCVQITNSFEELMNLLKDLDKNPSIELKFDQFNNYWNIMECVEKKQHQMMEQTKRNNQKRGPKKSKSKRGRKKKNIKSEVNDVEMKEVEEINNEINSFLPIDLCTLDSLPLINNEMICKSIKEIFEKFTIEQILFASQLILMEKMEKKFDELKENLKEEEKIETEKETVRKSSSSRRRGRPSLGNVQHKSKSFEEKTKNRENNIIIGRMLPFENDCLSLLFYLPLRLIQKEYTTSIFSWKEEENDKLKMFSDLPIDEHQRFSYFIHSYFLDKFYENYFSSTSSNKVEELTTNVEVMNEDEKIENEATKCEINLVVNDLVGEVDMDTKDGKQMNLIQLFSDETIDRLYLTNLQRRLNEKEWFDLDEKEQMLFEMLTSVKCERNLINIVQLLELPPNVLHLNDYIEFIDDGSIEKCFVCEITLTTRICIENIDGKTFPLCEKCEDNFRFIFQQNTSKTFNQICEYGANLSGIMCYDITSCYLLNDCRNCFVHLIIKNFSWCESFKINPMSFDPSNIKNSTSTDELIYDNCLIYINRKLSRSVKENYLSQSNCICIPTNINFQSGIHRKNRRFNHLISTIRHIDENSKRKFFNFIEDQFDVLEEVMDRCLSFYSMTTELFDDDRLEQFFPKLNKSKSIIPKPVIKQELMDNMNYQHRINGDGKIVRMTSSPTDSFNGDKMVGDRHDYQSNEYLNNSENRLYETQFNGQTNSNYSNDENINITEEDDNLSIGSNLNFVDESSMGENKFTNSIYSHSNYSNDYQSSEMAPSIQHHHNPHQDKSSPNQSLMNMTNIDKSYMMESRNNMNFDMTNNNNIVQDIPSHHQQRQSCSYNEGYQSNNFHQTDDDITKNYDYGYDQNDKSDGTYIGTIPESEFISFQSPHSTESEMSDEEITFNNYPPSNNSEENFMRNVIEPVVDEPTKPLEKVKKKRGPKPKNSDLSKKMSTTSKPSTSKKKSLFEDCVKKPKKRGRPKGVTKKSTKDDKSQIESEENQEKIDEEENVQDPFAKFKELKDQHQNELKDKVSSSLNSEKRRRKRKHKDFSDFVTTTDDGTIGGIGEVSISQRIKDMTNMNTDDIDMEEVNMETRNDKDIDHDYGELIENVNQVDGMDYFTYSIKRARRLHDIATQNCREQLNADFLRNQTMWLYWFRSTGKLMWERLIHFGKYFGISDEKKLLSLFLQHYKYNNIFDDQSIRQETSGLMDKKRKRRNSSSDKKYLTNRLKVLSYEIIDKSTQTNVSFSSKKNKKIHMTTMPNISSSLSSSSSSSSHVNNFSQTNTDDLYQMKVNLISTDQSARYNQLAHNQFQQQQQKFNNTNINNVTDHNQLKNYYGKLMENNNTNRRNKQQESTNDFTFEDELNSYELEKCKLKSLIKFSSLSESENNQFDSLNSKKIFKFNFVDYNKFLTKNFPVHQFQSIIMKHYSSNVIPNDDLLPLCRLCSSPVLVEDNEDICDNSPFFDSTIRCAVCCEFVHLSCLGSICSISNRHWDHIRQWICYDCRSCDECGGDEDYQFHHSYRQTVNEHQNLINSSLNFIDRLSLIYHNLSNDDEMKKDESDSRKKRKKKENMENLKKLSFEFIKCEGIENDNKFDQFLCCDLCQKSFHTSCLPHSYLFEYLNDINVKFIGFIAAKSARNATEIFEHLSTKSINRQIPFTRDNLMELDQLIDDIQLYLPINSNSMSTNLNNEEHNQQISRKILNEYEPSLENLSGFLTSHTLLKLKGLETLNFHGERDLSDRMFILIYLLRSISFLFHRRNCHGNMKQFDEIKSIQYRIIRKKLENIEDIDLVKLLFTFNFVTYSIGANYLNLINWRDVMFQEILSTIPESLQFIYYQFLSFERFCCKSCCQSLSFNLFNVFQNNYRPTFHLKHQQSHILTDSKIVISPSKKSNKKKKFHDRRSNQIYFQAILNGIDYPRSNILLDSIQLVEEKRKNALEKHSQISLYKDSDQKSGKRFKDKKSFQFFDISSKISNIFLTDEDVSCVEEMCNTCKGIINDDEAKLKCDDCSTYQHSYCENITEFEHHLIKDYYLCKKCYDDDKNENKDALKLNEIKMMIPKYKEELIKKKENFFYHSLNILNDSSISKKFMFHKEIEEKSEIFFKFPFDLLVRFFERLFNLITNELNEIIPFNLSELLEFENVESLIPEFESNSNILVFNHQTLDLIELMVREEQIIIQFNFHNLKQLKAKEYWKFINDLWKTKFSNFTSIHFSFEQFNQILTVSLNEFLRTTTSTNNQLIMNHINCLLLIFEEVLSYKRLVGTDQYIIHQKLHNILKELNETSTTLQIEKFHHYIYSIWFNQLSKRNDNDFIQFFRSITFPLTSKMIERLKEFNVYNQILKKKTFLELTTEQLDYFYGDDNLSSNEEIDIKLSDIKLLESIDHVNEMKLISSKKIKNDPIGNCINDLIEMTMDEVNKVNVIEDEIKEMLNGICNSVAVEHSLMKKAVMNSVDIISSKQREDETLAHLRHLLNDAIEHEISSVDYILQTITCRLCHQSLLHSDVNLNGKLLFVHRQSNNYCEKNNSYDEMNDKKLLEIFQEELKEKYNKSIFSTDEFADENDQNEIECDHLLWRNTRQNDLNIEEKLLLYCCHLYSLIHRKKIRVRDVNNFHSKIWWIHSNCAIWSTCAQRQTFDLTSQSTPLVNWYENHLPSKRLTIISLFGEIMKKSLICSHCDSVNATIQCAGHNCKNQYHFVCAHEAGALFTIKLGMSSNEKNWNRNLNHPWMIGNDNDELKVYCSRHIKRMAICNYVVTCFQVDGIIQLVEKQIQNDLIFNSKNSLMKCGSMTIRDLGYLHKDFSLMPTTSDKRNGINSNRFQLIPIDYEINRLFWSIDDPDRLSMYRCYTRIVEEKDDNHVYFDKEENLTAEIHKVNSFVESEKYLKILDDLTVDTKETLTEEIDWSLKNFCKLIKLLKEHPFSSKSSEENEKKGQSKTPNAIDSFPYLVHMNYAKYHQHQQKNDSTIRNDDNSSSSDEDESIDDDDDIDDVCHDNSFYSGDDEYGNDETEEEIQDGEEEEYEEEWRDGQQMENDKRINKLKMINIQKRNNESEDQTPYMIPSTNRVCNYCGEYESLVWQIRKELCLSLNRLVDALFHFNKNMKHYNLSYVFYDNLLSNHLFNFRTILDNQFDHKNETNLNYHGFNSVDNLIVIDWYNVGYEYKHTITSKINYYNRRLEECRRLARENQSLQSQFNIIHRDHYSQVLKVYEKELNCVRTRMDELRNDEISFRALASELRKKCVKRSTKPEPPQPIKRRRMENIPYLGVSQLDGLDFPYSSIKPIKPSTTTSISHITISTPGIIYSKNNTSSIISTTSSQLSNSFKLLKSVRHQPSIQKPSINFNYQQKNIKTVENFTNNPKYKINTNFDYTSLKLNQPKQESGPPNILINFRRLTTTANSMHKTEYDAKPNLPTKPSVSQFVVPLKKEFQENKSTVEKVPLKKETTSCKPPSLLTGPLNSFSDEKPSENWNLMKEVRPLLNSTPNYLNSSIPSNKKLNYLNSSIPPITKSMYLNSSIPSNNKSNYLNSSVAPNQTMKHVFQTPVDNRRKAPRMDNAKPRIEFQLNSYDIYLKKLYELKDLFGRYAPDQEIIDFLQNLSLAEMIFSIYQLGHTKERWGFVKTAAQNKCARIGLSLEYCFNELAIFLKRRSQQQINIPKPLSIRMIPSNLSKSTVKKEIFKVPSILKSPVQCDNLSDDQESINSESISSEYCPQMLKWPNRINVGRKEAKKILQYLFPQTKDMSVILSHLLSMDENESDLSDFHLIKDMYVSHFPLQSFRNIKRVRHLLQYEDHTRSTIYLTLSHLKRFLKLSDNFDSTNLLKSFLLHRCIVGLQEETIPSSFFSLTTTSYNWNKFIELDRNSLIAFLSQLNNSMKNKKRNGKNLSGNHFLFNDSKFSKVFSINRLSNKCEMRSKSEYSYEELEKMLRENNYELKRLMNRLYLICQHSLQFDELNMKKNYVEISRKLSKKKLKFFIEHIDSKTTYSSDTPYGVWKKVFDSIPRLKSSRCDGYRLFGLNEPVVHYFIEQLDNINQFPFYNRLSSDKWNTEKKHEHNFVFDYEKEKVVEEPDDGNSARTRCFKDHMSELKSRVKPTEVVCRSEKRNEEKDQSIESIGVEVKEKEKKNEMEEMTVVGREEDSNNACHVLISRTKVSNQTERNKNKNSRFITNVSRYDKFSCFSTLYRSPILDIYMKKIKEKILIKYEKILKGDGPLSMKYLYLPYFSLNALNVYKSKIHGRGLFTLRDISVGQPLIEYGGTVVRYILCDVKERVYDSQGIGCYMFSIDNHEAIDATLEGNRARFINHSCDPNCESRICFANGSNHIIILAMKNIRKAEELTYDYQFSIEANSTKIPCLCAAKNCRQFLN
ncbi:hypothetical protein SNEBB_006894 [Seison nebaliae]|nr:hypothetical protein SNEBB_006894 [Seison nebaliae]